MKIGAHYKPIGGFKVLIDETTSTQTFASELLKSEAIPHGTTVIARHQSQGKGRHDNVWMTTPGANFTGSIILKYEEGMEDFPISMISMFAAIAVRECMSLFVQAPVYIKWPNDIIVTSKKLAGILISNQWKGKRLESSILGIGINVNQTVFNPDLPKAGSLSSLVGYELGLNTIIETLLNCLNTHFDRLIESPYSETFNTFQNNLLGLNETVAIQFPQEKHIRQGKIVGVQLDGKILVALEESRISAYDIDEIKLIF